MSLPATLDDDIPAGSAAPSTLDNRIRETRTWLLDVFGIADDVAIAAAVSVIDASGLKLLAFYDVTSDPATAGHLGRNGANLLFHDGTAARTLVSTAATQTLSNKTLTSPVINTPALGADSVDAITEIAAALKSGADGTLVTGTAGTSGDLALWNADGDLVDGPTPPTGTIVGTSDTQTLTNKTITAPVLSGSVTGTYTLAGTPTLTSPTINTPTIATPTISNPTLSGTVTGFPTWSSNQTFPAVTMSTALGAGTPVANTLYEENIVKAWIVIDGDATPAVSLEDFNVSGFADTAVGRYTVTWDVDFADTNYAVIGTAQGSAAPIVSYATAGKAAGSVEIQARDDGGTLTDAPEVSIIAMGAQA